jgi:hypothetical protein
LKNLLDDGQLLLRLTSFVADKSRDGVPTEDIVEGLIQSRFLPRRTSNVLQEQLSPE